MMMIPKGSPEMVGFFLLGRGAKVLKGVKKSAAEKGLKHHST
jgi:hypothetical protein